MSRDFDRAQEMVVASMEYIKVLGFRIRRTEVQRDDWKQVAQSHADEMIKLRQHVDALKVERNAEGKAHDEYKERNREIFNGNQRLTAELAVIKDERDALRAECDDLRRVFSLVHGSLGIQQGEHIGNAIDALKKERDELATRLRQRIARGDFAEMRLATLAAELETERERHRQTAAVPQSVDVPRTHPVPCDPPEGREVGKGNGTACACTLCRRAEIERLKKPRQHPVKAGEYVRRLTGFNTTPAGEIAQVIRVHVNADSVEYDVLRPNGETGTWIAKNCAPCDPPEATHITPDGKATAQAAVTPQPGDVVRLVRVPTNDEYPHDSGRWEPNWGGIGDYMRVHYVGSNINGTRVVRAVFGLEWPVSCVEVVKGGDK